MHGGRYQWHNDNPLYGKSIQPHTYTQSLLITCNPDSVISIKDLQLNYVQQAGYVNLRCAWAIGCPAELEPARYYHERPNDVGHPTAMEFPDQFMKLFPGEPLPNVVGIPCCSQFAVSKEAVHLRSKKDYIRMRKWLLESPLDAATSGRIFEYAWHSMCISHMEFSLGDGLTVSFTVMFGKVAQLCLDMQECYCNTYGYCDMDDEKLSNQWVWRGLVLPQGWPNPEPEQQRRDLENLSELDQQEPQAYE